MALLTHDTAADDWPQWRGPSRTGIAADTLFPDRWPSSPPEPRWRVRIGEGYSSPVVAGGRVFILSREEENQESCLCFDANTGERLWQHAYAEAYKPPDPTAGIGPKSTPTVAGDQVFMIGAGGMLHALEAATGRVAWSHNCAAEYWGVEKDATGFDAWTAPCGAAGSGLVDGNLLIIPLGGKKAGAITAFDRRTGEIVWKGLTDRGSYGSPMVAELAGKRQVVGFTGLRMVGLNAATGELLWEHHFPANFEQTILTPVIWKDLVIFGGEQKPTIALRIEKQENAFTASVTWKSPELRSYLTSPVAIGDHLIGHDNRLQRLVCVSLETGQTNWTSDKIGQYAWLTLAGHRLLVLTQEGDFHVFDYNVLRCIPHVKWKLSEAGGVWSHLAVVKNRLYVKDKEHLACFEIGGQ
jgi:outer membrane protein assembly factor BamB